MSTDYNTYVGPYIKVYNPKKPSTKEYHSCTNKKCKNYEVELSSKFCDKCGDKIQLIKVPSSEAIDFDVYEKCNEVIAEVMCEYKPDELKEYNIYISNNRNKYNNSIYDPKYETYAINATVNSLTEDIYKFWMAFDKEIVKLKYVFGDDNVEIKWGVLGWTS